MTLLRPSAAQVVAVVDSERPICAFLHDLDALRRHVLDVVESLPPRAELFYAVKANNDPRILRTLAPHVAGFEVASSGEILKVRDAVGSGARIMRITSDPGASTAPVAGTWGSDARHVYSKQQPWNADQTLLSIENRSGGSPSPLILDGATYLPRYGRCANYALYDYRWHPARPHEQINVNPAGTELMWFDVTTCTKTRSWTLPITVDYGIGSGEGNPSHDGRFVALGNNTDMFVVDMDPQPPHAPYPNRRIGPVYHFPPESLTAEAPDEWTIGNLSISPSGRYVDVKFSSGDATTVDGHRIFEVDPVTLAPAPSIGKLRHLEPNFYVLGAKSHGRNPGFLLQAGFEQVREVFALIAGKTDLDFYKKR